MCFFGSRRPQVERQRAPSPLCVSMAVRQQLSVALLLALAGAANALAPQPSHAKIAPAQSQLRRRVGRAPLLAPGAGLASQPAHAASNTKKDAEAVLVKLEPLAGYIDDAKWDSVRTVLKTYVARRPRPPFAPRPRERAAPSRRAARETETVIRGLLSRRARENEPRRAARETETAVAQVAHRGAVESRREQELAPRGGARGRRPRADRAQRGPVVGAPAHGPVRLRQQLHLLPAGQRQAQVQGAQGPGQGRAVQAQADHRRALAA